MQQKHQQAGSKPTARQTATVNRTVKTPAGWGKAQLSSIPNSSVNITHNAMDEIQDLIQGLIKICSHLSGIHFSSIPDLIDDIHPPYHFRSPESRHSYFIYIYHPFGCVFSVSNLFSFHPHVFIYVDLIWFDFLCIMLCYFISCIIHMQRTSSIWISIIWIGISSIWMGILISNIYCVM